VRSTAAKFWIGAAFSIPVALLLGVAAFGAVPLLGRETAQAMVPVAVLLGLAAAVAGIVWAPSRWYVVGTLTGAAIIAVVLVIAAAVFWVGLLALFMGSAAH